ncbi:hypothetical protein BGX24_003016, partial [Mortierella sp. AD032]
MALKRGGILRLRLHRQIEVTKEEDYLHLTIGAKIRPNLGDTMPPPSFTLHYVELGTNCFQYSSPDQSIHRCDDYVLYGEGCPHQMIAVDRYNKEIGEKAAATKIRTYGISDKAEFAVTLHLREVLRPTNSEFTGITNATTINIEPTAGLAVAVAATVAAAAAAAGTNIRIQPLYDCKHTGRTDKIGEPRSIEVTTKRRCKELKEFSGHSLFHPVDPTKFDVSDDNDNERFVASNGSVLQVY